MIDHIPNSSGVSFLVTIKVKMIPVKTLIIATINAIRPEYVTRMSLKYFDFLNPVYPYKEIKLFFNSKRSKFHDEYT